MRRTARSVLSVLVVLCACLVAMPPANAATQPFKVLDLNYCGSTSDCGNYGATKHLLTDTFDTFKPDVVFFQEICQNQYAKIVSTQKAAGGHWQLYGAFDPVGKNQYGQVPDRDKPHNKSRCGRIGGHRLRGNAVLSHLPMAGHTSEAIDTTGSKPQRVLCAQLSASYYSAEACVTHIAPADNASVQDGEIATATGFAAKNGTGRPIVLGGDFNVQPSNYRLTRIYADGADSTGAQASGIYEESDQCAGNPRGPRTSTCNRYTHKSSLGGAAKVKLDYVFLRKSWFEGTSTNLLSLTWTDHLGLKVTSTLCSTHTC